MAINSTSEQEIKNPLDFTENTHTNKCKFIPIHWGSRSGGSWGAHRFRFTNAFNTDHISEFGDSPRSENACPHQIENTNAHRLTESR